LVPNDCIQKDVCDEIFKNVEEKFKVVNHRINTIDEKTDDLSSINASLVKLTLLSEQNIENNRNRDEILRIHGETLVQLTTALTHINEKFDANTKNINEKFGETDKSIKEKFGETDKSIEEVSQKVETMDNNNSIKINEVIKYLFVLVLGVGGTIIITKLMGG
jgi:response regulator RpfG family c-di-GMP phosphodiesterase